MKAGQYPNGWKVAEAKPLPGLPKCNNPTTTKEYRPISFLFHLGKLAEDVLLDSLKPSITPLLKKNQDAYISGLGTTDALIQITHEWLASLDKLTTSHIHIGLLMSSLKLR